MCNEPVQPRIESESKRKGNGGRKTKNRTRTEEADRRRQFCYSVIVHYTGLGGFIYSTHKSKLGQGDP